MQNNNLNPNSDAKNKTHLHKENEKKMIILLRERKYSFYMRFFLFGKENMKQFEYVLPCVIVSALTLYLIIF